MRQTRTVAGLRQALYSHTVAGLGVLTVWACAAGLSARAASVQPRYYGHPAVHDADGVIAPWYAGPNGPCDFRIRVAAETLKRYPWTEPGQAAAPAPAYVYNGQWTITPEGTIGVPPCSEWDNGDLGQRAAYVLSGLVDYYRYSGDPAAIAHLTYQADTLLECGLTPADHPWPGFPVSVPVKGKTYGRADPHGMIQLDIVAELGLGLLRAYQLTGNPRWFEAAKHWGDLLAAKRCREPGRPPWGRYANPEDVQWKDDRQTGGVVFLLAFFDELLRLGHRGQADAILEARAAGQAYLRDVLLPAWTVDDTWGRNYWDWPDPVQAENVTEFAARYLMEHPDAFPNWRRDARNILSLFLNRTSVSPASRGDVYSGAWAFPESSGCCGRSLWYGPMELAWPFAQYGVLADSEWARELARRIQILATYDGHESGFTEDNIDGGVIVNAAWFKIAHPMALKHLLATVAWQPDLFGSARETHVVRTSAVVTDVVCGPNQVEFATFDAPAGTTAVLRTAFVPTRVTADGQPLSLRTDTAANGYTACGLRNGDCLVTVRHDGARRVTVTGAGDPQQQVEETALSWTGDWQTVEDPADSGGRARVSRAAGATAEFAFQGDQVRLLGRSDPEGGLADVYLDGVRQAVGLDAWTPGHRYRQVLFWRNGLANAAHTLRVVVRGQGNPRSAGAVVSLDALAWSVAGEGSGYGAGGGPTDSQRLILGYPSRTDYADSTGATWRPGTEVVTRLRPLADAVAATWWTQPAAEPILGTPDPELYRYGLHAREFTVVLTVGPGVYHVRLKFAATRRLDTRRNCVSVEVCGRPLVARLDVAATAGGPNRALDLVANGVRPRNGVVDIRFVGGDPAGGLEGEAFVQAVEVGPGPAAETGVVAVQVGEDLLANPGFEGGVPVRENGGPREGEAGGWRFALDGPGQARLGVESAAGEAAADPGQGREALRVTATGGADVRLWQDVPVAPNREYAAGALVRTRDPDGHGFGRTTGDLAGLRVTELDATGHALAEHASADLSAAQPWTYLSARFRTGPATARLRLGLLARIGGDSDRGSVSFDRCSLDGPPPAGTVRGRVSRAGRPLAGARVTVGDQTATSAADGQFTLDGVPLVRRPVPLRAEAPDCYPLERRVVPAADSAALDLELIGPPASNRLANPGFEDGIPEYVRQGPLAGNGWRFETIPGNSVIAPESFYTQHRSLGCPEFHGGQQAVRVSSTNGHDRICLFQDVPVAPGALYVASAFVRTRDFQGAGFGQAATDSAGVHLQELDATGTVVVDHPPAAVTAMTGYTCVYRSFTTGPQTRAVRFALESVIECPWTEGNVTYDDCALDGPAAPPAP